MDMILIQWGSPMSALSLEDRQEDRVPLVRTTVYGRHNVAQNVFSEEIVH